MGQHETRVLLTRGRSLWGPRVPRKQASSGKGSEPSPPPRTQLSLRKRSQFLFFKRIFKLYLTEVKTSPTGVSSVLTYLFFQSSTDIHMLPRAKRTASGKLLGRRGSSARALRGPRGWPRGAVCTYTWLIRDAVQHKRSQFLLVGTRGMGSSEEGETGSPSFNTKHRINITEAFSSYTQNKRREEVSERPWAPT